MTKQLPEEQQYEVLLTELAGNQAFKRLREQSLPDPLKLAMCAESPSSFCKQWDAQASDWRIMGNLVARLKRDGMGNALEALEHSLRSGLMLPGEEDPISALITLTFVMPEAETTLLLLRFLMYQAGSRWKAEYAPEVYEKFAPLRWLEQWNEGFKFSGQSNRQFDDVPKELTDLFERALKEHIERDGGPDWSLMAKVINYVLEEIQRPYSEKLQLLKPIGNPSFPYYTYDVGYHGQYAGTNFLFVTTTPSKDVLKQFSREEQESLALWTIPIPVYHWKNSLGNGQPGNFADMARFSHLSPGRSLQLSLFPESLEQRHFECGWSSSNATFGYGLWLGPHDYWKEKGRYYPNQGGITFTSDGDFQNSGPLLLDTYLRHNAK